MQNNKTQSRPRREFLKQCGLGALALTLPNLKGFAGNFSPDMFNSNIRIALQLYTVRKDVDKDVEGTLKKVAELGYRNVETAFFPSGITIPEAGKLLKKTGLSVCSVHAEIPEGKNKDIMLQMAEAYECKRMIWHGWPENKNYRTVEGTKVQADIYNEANHFARSNGLEFGLHNHWWECQVQDRGRYPYQVLLDYLDKDIFFEVDTYWAKVAGLEPARLITELGARVKYLHMKDGPATIKDPMVALGKGSQDLPAIAAAAAHAGVEWMVVEMDECATDIYKAITENLNYLVDHKMAVNQ